MKKYNPYPPKIPTRYEEIKDHYISQRDHIEDISVSLARICDAIEQKTAESKCEWTDDWEMGASECSCGESFLWEDYKGTDCWKYCPICGKKIGNRKNIQN